MAIPEGYTPLAKIGISYKGDYVSGTAYAQLDAVYYNGSTYLALINSPAVVPTNDGVNWRFLAKGTAETIIESYEDLMANTVAGYLPDALVVKKGLDIVNESITTTMLPETESFTVEEDVDNYLDTVSDNMPVGTYYKRKVVVAVQHSVFGGGFYLLEGFKSYDGIETQKLTRNAAVGISQIVRCKSNGGWGMWIPQAGSIEITGHVVQGDVIVISSARIENGMVVITGYLPAGAVSGNYTAAIDTMFAPRLSTTGCPMYSSGNDAGAAVAVYAGTNGSISAWINKSLTANMNFIISYPLKMR